MSNDRNGSGHIDELDESDKISDEDIVHLIDEDGNEHAFVLLAIVTLDDVQQFAMLSPLEQVQDEEEPELELFLFTYQETDEGYAEFGEIEDDETYEAVQAYCATLIDNEQGGGEIAEA